MNIILVYKDKYKGKDLYCVSSATPDCPVIAEAENREQLIQYIEECIELFNEVNPLKTTKYEIIFYELFDLYTQDMCSFCQIMKDKLYDWNFVYYNEINVTTKPKHREWLKSKGHKTVPQLYSGTININENINTKDITLDFVLDKLRNSSTNQDFHSYK